MSAYVVIVILSVTMGHLVSYNGRRPGLLALLLVVLPGAWLASIRVGIGPDYGLYERAYYAFRDTGTFFSLKEFEPGFVYLCKSLGYFGFDYHVLLFVIALMVEWSYLKEAVVRSPSFTMSVLLFFLGGTYFDAMNGLRQYVAAAIAFRVLSATIEGRPYRFVGICLLAASFHLSALVLLVLYPLAVRFRPRAGVMLGLPIVLTVFGGVLLPAVAYLLRYTRYGYFLGSAEFEVSPTAATIGLTTVVTVLGAYVLKTHGCEVRKGEHIFYFFQLAAHCSALLSLFVPLAYRLQIYFVPFELVFLPFVLARFGGRAARSLVALILCCVLGLELVFGIVYSGRFGVYPFVSTVWS